MNDLPEVPSATRETTPNNMCKTIQSMIESGKQNISMILQETVGDIKSVKYVDYEKETLGECLQESSMRELDQIGRHRQKDKPIDVSSDDEGNIVLEFYARSRNFLKRIHHSLLGGKFRKWTFTITPGNKDCD